MNETKRAAKPIKATKANITRILTKAGKSKAEQKPGGWGRDNGFVVVPVEYADGHFEHYVWHSVADTYDRRPGATKREEVAKYKAEAQYAAILTERFNVERRLIDDGVHWVVTEKQDGQETK